jgi:ADP-ribose pyrophosphatase
MAEKKFYEDLIASEQVFDGKLLHVLRDRVRLPNGDESVREYIRHPGAVVVIAFLDNGKLLFERQYRYPLQRVMLELPAGKIDFGEDLVKCGKRELREETGYEAAEWHHVATIHPCIGYSDERIEIFHARGLTYVGANLDHGEQLETVELSLDAALASVVSGKITDAKTIACLWWAERIDRQGRR